MGEKINCGINELRKNERRGSMKECAEKKQIKYYGLKKVDSKLLEGINKSEKKRMTLQKARISMVGLRARIGAIERKIDIIKHKSKEKKDEKKDKAEIKELEKEMSEKKDLLKEAIKQVKRLEEEKSSSKKKSKK
jgi:translation initiation factor 2B subunit (eIF-2B alpha/beta/delta family)